MKATERLLQKLKLGTALDADDAKAIKRLPVIVKELAPHTAIVREGERPHQCCLVGEGFLCRSKTTDGAKRQILSSHIPGETPSLRCLSLPVTNPALPPQSRSVAPSLPPEPLRALT